MKLFHERYEEANDLLPKTFQYESFSDKVRLQIINTIMFKNQHVLNSYTNVADQIYLDLITSFGVESLNTYDKLDKDVYLAINKYIKAESDTIKLLSCLELTLNYISTYHYRNYPFNNENFDNTIDLINDWLKRSGLGWTYKFPHILKIEDEDLYQYATSPLITKLNNDQYSSAFKHYLESYNHIRESKNNEAITSVCKAMESVLKVWLVINNIETEENTKKMELKSLIKKFSENVNTPVYMQTYYENLKTILSGQHIPRNKDSAHGQIVHNHIHIDDNMTLFLVNLATSNMLFIVDAKPKIIQT